MRSPLCPHGPSHVCPTGHPPPPRNRSTQQTRSYLSGYGDGFCNGWSMAMSVDLRFCTPRFGRRNRLPTLDTLNPQCLALRTRGTELFGMETTSMDVRRLSVLCMGQTVPRPTREVLASAPAIPAPGTHSGTHERGAHQTLGPRNRNPKTRAQKARHCIAAPESSNTFPYSHAFHFNSRRHTPSRDGSPAMSPWRTRSALFLRCGFISTQIMDLGTSSLWRT